VGINLTPKGWAAATPGTLDAPQAERVCGHACLICQIATVSPRYRDWARLAFKLADLDAWLLENPDKRTALIDEHRARLIKRIAAAKDAI
jgi:hypothetical protein